MRLTVALVALTLALAPVAWAQPGLTTEVVTSAEDLDWLHEQFERISATKSLGVLSGDQVGEMVQEARALAVTIAITGELREMELADALDALVKAAAANRNRGSAAVVMTQAARDRLGGVAVSASFHRTPFGAAVQALVGAVESDDPAVEVEETSRGVFVVRVHEDEDEDEDEDDDEDGAQTMPQPDEDDDGERGPEQDERRAERAPAPTQRGADLGDDSIAPRGFLGVTLAEAQEPGLTGVRLGTVMADGPAARAGLRAGDVLQTFGGKAVRTATELLALIQRRSVGEEVEVTYLRQGVLGGTNLIPETARVTLSARPASR